MSDGQNRTPALKGKPRGRPFPPGNRANPGGRPKKLREIEALLDAEHRTVANMREVFTRLKALALGEVIIVPGEDDEPAAVDLKAHPAFMDLYLNRVLGPPEKLRLDLSDAPDEVVAYLADKLN